MKMNAITTPRVVAGSLWAASLAAAYAVTAALRTHRQDIAETARLARQAGHHQGRLERDT